MIKMKKKTYFGVGN